MGTPIHHDERPWLDLSMPIHGGMVTWPGDPPVRVTTEQSVEAGDEATVSRLDAGVHTGTHVDAPVHFLPGAAGVDELDLSALIGEARVVEVPETRVITAEQVDALGIAPGERLLFKTRNSDRCFDTDGFVEDYTHLSLEAARRLAEAPVRTVGVDYLSVGGGDENPDVHRLLLAAGVCIVEGVNLSGVAPGDYDLVCLPLRIRGGDGAPARVVVRRRPPRNGHAGG